MLFTALKGTGAKTNAIALRRGGGGGLSQFSAASDEKVKLL